jgi:TrmH family RNA methyltransferase
VALHQARPTRTAREISSAGNSLLKVFRRALAEGITRQGWLAVEGPFLVEEALSAAPAVRMHSVLASKSGAEKFSHLLKRLPAEAETVQVPDRLFAQVAQTQTPQGIAALVELPPPDLDQILVRGDAVLLVACGVQDPGNLGTMLRSAQAFGATALLTLKDTVSPFNPKAVRSSVGAIFRLPVVPGLEAGSLFEVLRKRGIRLVAADRRSPSSLAEADLRAPLALLVGREATGLPPEISREAQQLLSIPICPGMDSVNAATAASIFLYEAARQRGFKY